MSKNKKQFSLTGVSLKKGNSYQFNPHQFMIKILFRTLIMCTSCIIPLNASAGLIFTIENPGVQHSAVSAVTTETFDSGSPGAFSGPIFTNLGYLSVGGYKVSSNSSATAYLYGGADMSQYYGVGEWSGQTAATITFTSPQNYFGMWWPAGDARNQLNFYNDTTLLGSYRVGNIIPLLSDAYFGNPNYSPKLDPTEPFVYLNFTTTGSDHITRIEFLNDNTLSGFEIDNISVTDQSITPPGHTLATVYLLKAVKPSFSGLWPGNKYQLQLSGDMNTWTNHGSTFTATNDTMIYPQCWEVGNWGELFFRLEVSP
jgi:hypothetical protein